MSSRRDVQEVNLWSRSGGEDAREAAICQLHEATAIYTALPVVSQMLERARWPERGGRLLDPSAGDGAFLIVALKRLAPTPNDWEAIDRVRGYEIHPGAVAEAHRNIASELRTQGWSDDSARIAARRIVVERDFLLNPGEEKYAAICGNPPYLRLARVPEYFKELYRPLIRSHAFGDLLHAFIDSASQMIDPEGCVVLVTADRWLANESAADLREVLGSRLSIAYLARLDETTCFYRAKTRKANTLPRVHPVEVMLVPKGQSDRLITRAPICPDAHPDVDATGLTLGEIANIRIGAWLGPFGVFVVWNEDAARMPEGDWVPVVDTDDIDPHTDELRKPTRMGLRSVRGVEPTGAVAAHLQAMQHKLPARAKRGPYWMPPESLRPDTDEASILVPRIARRLRCVELPAGTHAVNHNLSILSVGTASLDLIRRVLLAPASHDWLMRHAPRLEGGYLSITTRLLRRLPVPAELVESARPALG